MTRLARLLARRRGTARPLRQLAALALAIVLLPLAPVAAHAGTPSSAAASTSTSASAGSPAARSAVAAMQPGWNMGNTYDASSDQVFLPKSSAITDRTLTLDSNGTDFQGLRHAGRELVRGADYTVTGDRLTLTAAALTRLAGDRAYGVDATLEALFSRGVPWRIDVITYDTPVLSDTAGTTSAFSVPTQFRGDSLATMEAGYDHGSNAGPADWTPFQQYDTSFSAYTADAIKLTPEFFNAVRDGSRITLTFHFWSGATVTYHVTRAGTAVTGTNA